MKLLKGINLTGPRLAEFVGIMGPSFWKWEKSTLLEFIGNSNPDSPPDVKILFKWKKSQTI